MAPTATTDKPSTDKKSRQRKEKPPFDFATAVDAKGKAIALDEGRLTGVPVNWDSAFEKLGRKNFATAALFAEFRLVEFDKDTAKREERRKELVEAITEAKEGVTPQKKALKKFKKMQSAMAALQKQLEADGVDLSKI